VNVLSLFHDLKARGVIVEVQGGLLKVDAPTGVLNDADRAALKELSPGSSSACLALTRSRRRRRSARAWRVGRGRGSSRHATPSRANGTNGRPPSA
jgi:hypothetical protein